MNSAIVRVLAKSIAFEDLDTFNHDQEATTVQSLLDMKADPLYGDSIITPLEYCIFDTIFSMFNNF